MQQITNYSVTQEQEVLKTLHFDHTIYGYTPNRSMHELNRVQSLAPKYGGSDSLIHVIYEMLTQPEHRMMLDMLNMLGQYGSLLFYQLNQYTWQNKEFYGTNHPQKRTTQDLRLLCLLGLVERLRFSITADAYTDKDGRQHPQQVRDSDAYTLTERGRELIRHQEPEMSQTFPPALNSNDNYANYLHCWQIYDFDYLLKKQDSFIQAQVEVDRHHYVQYHCWIEQGEQTLLELVVNLPLQMKLLIANQRLGKQEAGYTYNQNTLIRYARRFHPRFYGVKPLPESYANYKVKQYGVIRVSQIPRLSDFKALYEGYNGSGELLLLIGNGYDNGVRFDEQVGKGQISNCFYHYEPAKNDQDKPKLSRIVL